jgi:hypothetical protein
MVRREAALTGGKAEGERNMGLAGAAVAERDDFSWPVRYAQRASSRTSISTATNMTGTSAAASSGTPTTAGDAISVSRRIWMYSRLPARPERASNKRRISAKAGGKAGRAVRPAFDEQPTLSGSRR